MKKFPLKKSRQSLKEGSFAKMINVYKTKDSPITIKEWMILMANMKISIKTGSTGGKNKIV